MYRATRYRVVVLTYLRGRHVTGIPERFLTASQKASKSECQFGRLLFTMKG